jgi:hypothetical protein
MKARALSRWALVLALVLGTGFVAAESRAQAYKYKDERGHVHFTENYYEVPEKFRKQIETREMPTVVDPNSPAENAPAPGTTAASFEDGLRHGMGRDLTVKQQDALHAWMKRWMWPWIAALMLNGAIALSMVVHAFLQGRIGWGLANFFIGVSSPFYILLKLEQSAVVRIALLVLYLAPFVVMAMAISELVKAIS